MNFKLQNLDVELFAVGKWNGIAFSLQDLEEVATNFGKLAAVHKVPLKFGHNDKQPITDGQPALGWVTKVWVEGTKLMGHFEKVPEIVAKAIKQQMYRRVSIELDIDVEHKGTKYRYVLSGVALLGADLPAVNTLADLETYLDGDTRLEASRRASFSAITGQMQSSNKLEVDMTKEEIEALLNQKLVPFMEANTKLTQENVKLTQENVTLKSQVEKFTSDNKAREEAEKAAKVKSARETATKVLDDGVKAQAITPAQRETFIKTLGINDDEHVLKLTVDDVKAIIPQGKKVKMGQQEGKGQGEGDGTDGDERVHDNADQELDRLATDIVAKNPKISYGEATRLAMRNNPELAKEWLGTAED